jgi:hypothetical protein
MTQFNTDFNLLYSASSMTQHQKKSLRFSYYEAFVTSFTVGLSENYFAAYAVESGQSTLGTGLLISIPLVFAACIQFFVFHKFKSLSVSTVVKNAVLIQCIPLIILSILALLNVHLSFSSLLGIYSVYWTGQFMIQPAWNRWIAELIPPGQAQSYFSLRTRLSQIGIVAGIIIGGLTLHMQLVNISPQRLYFYLFIFGFICKIVSYFLFLEHTEVHIPIRASTEKIFSYFKKHLPFFKSYGLYNFSIFLSSPFVIGYLLNEQKLDYFSFMIVMSTLFIGKIMMSSWLHRKTTDIDPTKLMSYGALCIAPLPLLWPICTQTYQMALLHLISGISWASWEVGLSLCFFKNISAEQKTEVISLYNYVGTFSQILGTCAGALIVYYIFKSNYNLIFILAGIIRLICALPLQKNKLSLLTK